LRTYELLFIIRPTLSDQDVDALIEQVKGHITNLGFTVTKANKLGRRHLAYEIDRLREGTYMLFTFDGDGAGLVELDRRLRVTDSVLRHSVIRIDQDAKRAERLKQKRAEKAMRRGQTAASRQAASGEFEEEGSENEETA
jgi:small subunit ribosomal protein S6